MNEELLKEALLNPHMAQGFKNMFLSAKPLVKKTDEAVHVTKNPTHLQPGTVKMFSPEEIAEEIRRKDLEQGNGMVLDGLLGGTKWVANKVTQKVKGDKDVIWSGSDVIDNTSLKLKEKARELNTRGGAKMMDLIGGNKPGSFRGKLFSTGVDTKIGERVLEDGSVIPIMEKQRRASAVAPVENTVRMATPFLASAYLAEKMMPPEKDKTTVRDMAETLPSAVERLPMTRHASEVVFELDKQAMLDKHAILEERLLEKEAQLNVISQERDLMEKLSADLSKRADAFEKQASELRESLMEKEAAHEELILRMAARERYVPAEKIATRLLEQSMIKQAEYESKIAELMDCSDDVFKLYEKMYTSGKYGEESIESLAFLEDTYISSNEQSSSRVGKGLSKTGQTIGEAAHELSSKRNGG